MTCVSGYWLVKNKHTGNSYSNWFKNSLAINCPYVFFGNKESIALIKQFRGELPTYYIEYEIENFETYKYKDRMAIHDRHCPSVELNLIWNEKIFMIQKASIVNPFNSSYFSWVDAGHCSYRNSAPPNKPFPDLNKLVKLPQNKFIYTSSDSPYFKPPKLDEYYHYISGTYCLHISIINRFSSLYITYLDKLLNKGGIYTDQVILTYIYNDYPDIFHNLGHGYGEIVPLLY